MGQKADDNETLLSAEQLGDEKIIRAVLAGWGIESAAIGRIVREHRARLKRSQETLSDTQAKIKLAPASPASSKTALFPER